jgi:hypothetical protein
LVVVCAHDVGSPGSQARLDPGSLDALCSHPQERADVIMTDTITPVGEVEESMPGAEPDRRRRQYPPEAGPPGAGPPDTGSRPVGLDYESR